MALKVATVSFNYDYELRENSVVICSDNFKAGSDQEAVDAVERIARTQPHFDLICLRNTSNGRRWNLTRT